MSALANIFNYKNSRQRRIVSWFIPPFLLVLAGMITMNEIGQVNDFFTKQVVWLLVAGLVYFVLANYDHRPLRRQGIILGLYGFIVVTLLALFVIGSAFQGAQSWFDVGFFAIQPADPAKIVIILILAKYLSRRHIEIASLRHVLVSFLYVVPIVGLLIIQPDFGSAMVVLAVWLAMLIVSGIPFKRLLMLAAIGVSLLAFAWNFVFLDYQQDRIKTFFDPYADISGTGYNVYQSLVAVSAGGVMGRGVGEGTQSRLGFLPESETDFIFASFVEEWGIVGAMIVFALFSIIIYRLVRAARIAESNFEALYLLGFASLILIHFALHVSINLGLLPATGITLSFMSYGGSHLITLFAGLGLAVTMSNRARYQATKELGFVE